MPLPSAPPELPVAPAQGETPVRFRKKVFPEMKEIFPEKNCYHFLETEGRCEKEIYTNGVEFPFCRKHRYKYARMAGRIDFQTIPLTELQEDYLLAKLEFVVMDFEYERKKYKRFRPTKDEWGTVSGGKWNEDMEDVLNEEKRKHDEEPQVRREGLKVEGLEQREYEPAGLYPAVRPIRAMTRRDRLNEINAELETLRTELQGELQILENQPETALVGDGMNRLEQIRLRTQMLNAEIHTIERAESLAADNMQHREAARLGAIANDPQNVHREDIRLAQNPMLFDLLKTDENVIQADTLIPRISEAILELRKEESGFFGKIYYKIFGLGLSGRVHLFRENLKSQMALTERFSYLNPETNLITRFTYRELANKMMIRILQSQNKKELARRFMEEVVDGVGYCMTGKITRLLNVFTGFPEFIQVDTRTLSEKIQDAMTEINRTENVEMSKRERAKRALDRLEVPESQQAVWLDAFDEDEPAVRPTFGGEEEEETQAIQGGLENSLDEPLLLRAKKDN
jgi:hypothetical protein